MGLPCLLQPCRATCPPPAYSRTCPPPLGHVFRYGGGALQGGRSQATLCAK